MEFGAKRSMAFMRLVLAIAFIFSSLSYSMPIAEASGDTNGAAVASLEHDHSAISERVSSIAGSPSSEADDNECIPDGKSHSGHDNSSSDCCAAVCFDLTMLSSEGYRETKSPPALSVELLQSVIAVGPYRFLRPPRA